MVFHVEPRPAGAPRRAGWPWFAGGLVVIAVLVVGLNAVATSILGGHSGADNAREELLTSELPRLVRDMEVADPEHGNRGPASVAFLQEHLRRDTVLRSSSKPGHPAPGEVVGTVDVRMVRTSAGDTWTGAGTEDGTAVICVRFEAVYYDYRFQQIDCP